MSAVEDVRAACEAAKQFYENAGTVLAMEAGCAGTIDEIGQVATGEMRALVEEIIALNGQLSEGLDTQQSAIAAMRVDQQAARGPIEGMMDNQPQFKELRSGVRQLGQQVDSMQAQVDQCRGILEQAPTEAFQAAGEELEQSGPGIRRAGQLAIKGAVLSRAAGWDVSQYLRHRL